MIPITKIRDIISKHDSLEKELSSGSVEPKLFAKKSKEYSSLGGIISIAKEYVNFDKPRHTRQIPHRYVAGLVIVEYYVVGALHV